MKLFKSELKHIAPVNNINGEYQLSYITMHRYFEKQMLINGDDFFKVITTNRSSMVILIVMIFSFAKFSIGIIFQSYIQPRYR